jgi:type I restriction enzyme S subunit
MSTATSQARLRDVAAFNPSLGAVPAKDEIVSFLPMSAVDADTVDAVDGETRHFNEVNKGYTPFVANDVLVAKITPCFENGKIAQAKPTRRFGFGSTEFHVVRPHADKLDPRYLVYFLRQDRIRKAGEQKMTGSAGQRRVPEHFLANLTLPLPALPEQRRIAEILDKADALRTKRRAAIAQLNTLRKSIFLDMFGDPVTNPKGWPNPSVGGVLSFQQYGPRFYNESYSQNGVRIVRITDLSDTGSLNFDSMPKLAVSSRDREKYLLRAGDLIFARTGATVGKLALIQPNAPECIAGAYFITMRFDARIDPHYALAVFSAPSIKAIVAQRSRQAAQQNFSGPALRRLPMPCPPLELQRQFARKTEAIDAIRNTQSASLACLDALFATAQHRAFPAELLP